MGLESVGQNHRDRSEGVKDVVKFVMVDVDRPEKIQNHGTD